MSDEPKKSTPRNNIKIAREALKAVEIRAGLAISETALNITDVVEEIKTPVDALIGILEIVEGVSNNVNDMKKTFIDDIRSLRTIAVSEAQQITRPLEDLRKFFLGDDHDKEVARLKEFVEVCERMKALKDSGFLDTVADTILKIS